MHSEKAEERWHHQHLDWFPVSVVISLWSVLTLGNFQKEIQVNLTAQRKSMLNQN